MNNEFEKVINLLKKNDKETYPTFAYSVLNNYIPGQVYMDELKKTVLVGTDSGIFVVGGNEMNNGLNSIFLDISNFLENGFGYCLLHNDTVVSECTSIFSSSQFAEIDIATQNKYRGMGLAQNVAEIFIEHCIERTLKPNWDCDVNNFTSIKLAERLGFENPMEYSLFVRR